MLTILFALFLLAFGFWFLRRPRTKNIQVAHEKKASSNLFAGVEIRCDANACSGANDLIGKALLATNAPTLPLPQCPNSICDCRYVKTTDRREDIRRASDAGIRNSIFGAAEQRLDRDRRKI